MNALIPLIAMTLLNLWTSLGLLVQKNYPMALVFFCYAVATVGFIFATKQV
jgi:hypothetical protein